MTSKQEAKQTGMQDKQTRKETRKQIVSKNQSVDLE